MYFKTDNAKNIRIFMTCIVDKLIDVVSILTGRYSTSLILFQAEIYYCLYRFVHVPLIIKRFQLIIIRTRFF